MKCFEVRRSGRAMLKSLTWPAIRKPSEPTHGATGKAKTTRASGLLPSGNTPGFVRQNGCPSLNNVRLEKHERDNMTFEKEMDRFWKAFAEAQRKFLEQNDSHYQDAMTAQNAPKAIEIACSVLLAGGDAKQKHI